MNMNNNNRNRNRNRTNQKVNNMKREMAENNLLLII